MYNHDKVEQTKNIISRVGSWIAKGGIYSALAIVLFIVGNAATYKVDGGEYVIERPPSGNLKAIMTPGYKFKVPFLTDIYRYNRVTTVTYDTKDSGAFSDNQPKLITFADTYSGDLSTSFRITLPADPAKFIDIHNTYKRYENLVENGYEKFTGELMTYTATQFMAENFMQGGQNEYRNALKDQAENGLYITKRTATNVTQQVASVDSNSKAGQVNMGNAVRWVNIVQKDSKGIPLRDSHTLTKYGVTVDGVTLDSFHPEEKLRLFMSNKKDRIQARAKLVEDQETERQQAITEQLKGERERIQAKQKALRDRDQAVISAEKQVLLAEQQALKEIVEQEKQADIAKIDKAKELQIAQDNEGIQKANEKAAKYEAQALLHKGIAEAKIIDAKYKAYDKKLYAMEIQRDTMLGVTQNLQGISVDMPHINIGSNGDASGPINSVEVAMQALGLQKLEEIAKTK